MSSEETFGGPSGANNSTIEYAETAVINGVNGKKVFNLDSQGNIQELTALLRVMIQAINYPPWIDRSANAIRNQVQSGTVTTVSTVTNMTNLNGNFGSFTADHLQRQANITAWATNVRGLIT